MIAVHVEGAVIIIEIVEFGRRQVTFVITEHTRTLLLFDRFPISCYLQYTSGHVP